MASEAPFGVNNIHALVSAAADKHDYEKKYSSEAKPSHRIHT
jgi:hypothetical protein